MTSMNMNVMRPFGILTLILFLAACGGDTKKKGTTSPNNAGNNQNNVNNLNNSNNQTNLNNIDINNIDPELCGNGQLDTNEVCDPLILEGEGACPTECVELECATVSLVGDPTACTARCQAEPFACTDGDGCCPSGCDSSNDSECTNRCGNGEIEAGELCDGDCPTSCGDGDSCTRDQLEGSADTCNAQCSYPTIASCTNGDGCCPPGCTAQTDDDCACNPTTSCAAEGAECGTIFDGCQMVSCGGCAGIESCNSATNQCEQTQVTGVACTTNSQCNGGTQCATEGDLGWPGGYCTLTCRTNSECAADAHCGFINDDGDGFCVANCSTNSDCRSGYECFDDDAAGTRECAPVANGTGSTGSACNLISDCRGGRDGFCIRQGNDWFGGYCSESCSSNSDCPSGSHCSQSFGTCLQTCTSSCSRSGYACIDRDDDGTNECFNAATGSRGVGEACTGTWQCSGGEWGFCLPEQTNGEISGGYCSIACGLDEGTCPNGSQCWDSGSGSLCLDECANGSCRSGYTCFDVDSDIDTEDACWL